MRIRRAAPLLLAAAALPGCYVVNVCVPLDASGMKRTADWASQTLEDQVQRTESRVAGLPAALDRHIQESTRNLTRDPRDF